MNKKYSLIEYAYILNNFHKGWAFFLTNSENTEEVILNEILSSIQTAKPLNEPYYVLINRGEESTIKIQPLWKLVYKNSDVAIYYRGN